MRELGRPHRGEGRRWGGSGVAWQSTRVMADRAVTWWSTMLAVAAMGSRAGRTFREALLGQEERKAK